MDTIIFDLDGTLLNTLDDLMNTWNEKWTNAQESLGVEVNQ